MKEYRLLSGEIIGFSDLSREEQKHISKIEELIANQGIILKLNVEHLLR